MHCTMDTSSRNQEYFNKIQDITPHFGREIMNEVKEGIKEVVEKVQGNNSRRSSESKDSRRSSESKDSRRSSESSNI
uniref:Uncharacterized protein n=1 Tax=Panagrolaimus sp. ES5 TaxID=591445 RepID=A0AC34GSH4_9BILA